MSDVLNYYLISFNTEVEVADPTNPIAAVNLEGFMYLGNECEYFETLMGAEDRLPCNDSQVLSRMRMVQRMNPQRHIRIYGVRSQVDKQTLEEFCREMPQLMEQSIKENGVLL